MLSQPIFVTASHPNYLKSARLYRQKMYALKDNNPEVHQKFHSGWPRSYDRADTNALTQKPKRVDARERDVRAPENSLSHVIHYVIPLQPCHARSYRKKLRNK